MRTDHPILIRRPSLAFLLLFSAALAITLLARTAPAQQQKSFVIVEADVADGSGGPLVRANVRVIGDRIARVGNFTPDPGEDVVDARGLVLAPGFIDAHNHSDRGLQTDPLAESQISQGLTTLLLGQDGSSPWPIADYLEKFRKDPPALNFAMLAGHATIRRKVMERISSAPRALKRSRRWPLSSIRPCGKAR